MAIGRIKCRSGLEGWTCPLRENYDNNLASFEQACEYYNIHGRLGYETPEEAWDANPVIRGSVNPSDLQRQDKGGNWLELPEEG